MSKTEIFATLWLLNLLLQCCKDHGSYAIRREILPLLQYFLEINQGHQRIGGKKNLYLLVTNIIFTWSPLKPPDLSMMLSISSGNNTITISTWAMSALVRVYKFKFWKSYIKYQLCSWSLKIVSCVPLVIKPLLSLSNLVNSFLIAASSWNWGYDRSRISQNCN